MADFAATDQDETQATQPGDQGTYPGRVVAFGVTDDGTGGQVTRIDPIIVRVDP